MPLRKSTGRVATRTRTAPDGTIMRALHHAQHSREPPDIHAAFGPNHDPSTLDRDRGRRRNRLLRCHHDRYKHGRLVRRQRQLAAPRCLAPGKQMLRADLMSACHLRHDRARRKRFRDDPPLVRVTPPSPATNATANLDAPSRRESVNYIVDHICEPMPSTGSHLPNYAARCKMGKRHRLRYIEFVEGVRRSPSKANIADRVCERYGDIERLA